MAMASVFTDTILSTSLKSLKVQLQTALLIIVISYYIIVTLYPIGLPAHESDIQVGDIIVEVESTDVTRANGDLVVSIVRFGPESLHSLILLCKQLSVSFKCDNGRKRERDD